MIAAGADRAHPLRSTAPRGASGKYAEARGGTLLLNEIGSLPQPAQARLLGLLDDPRGTQPDPRRRVDGSSPRRTAAWSTASPPARFREDLFHRLNVLPIWMPPLRERRSDIPELANRMLTRLAAESRRGAVAISDTGHAAPRGARLAGKPSAAGERALSRGCAEQGQRAHAAGFSAASRQSVRRAPVDVVTPIRPTRWCCGAATGR